MLATEVWNEDGEEFPTFTWEPRIYLCMCIESIIFSHLHVVSDRQWQNLNMTLKGDAVGMAPTNISPPPPP